MVHFKGEGHPFIGGSLIAVAASGAHLQTGQQPNSHQAGQLSSSSPAQTVQTSSLSQLNPSSDGLAFSAGKKLNEPALLGMSSELSSRTERRLEYLAGLKTTYRTTLNEAMDKEGQDILSRLTHVREESALERYLRDLTKPTGFAFAWELCILPFLVKTLPYWLGRGYAINVLQNSVKSPARVICFTSRRESSRIRRMIIARHVLDVIPSHFHDTTSFQFCHGIVERLVLQRRGEDKEHLDEVCDAKNPYFYLEPMMGDSIGPSSDSSAATLGPCVKVSDRYYWLANLHVFIQAWRSENWDSEKCWVRHPGYLDGTICWHPPLQHSARYVKLGKLGARSGDNLNTTRRSCHPYWTAVSVDPPEVVTDWVLISDARPAPNTLRISGAFDDGPQCPYVTTVSTVLPCASVASTGRTSGHQYGQICCIPAYLDSEHDQGALKASREWFIEQPQDSEMSEAGWLENGPGLPGDSGAPVVDANNNSLYCQLWGRNKYWGPGPRISYFATMQDIDLDIQERVNGAGPLELPQCKAQDMGVFSCMACHYCQNSLSNSGELHSQGSNSDQMSEMSIENLTENLDSLFGNSVRPTSQSPKNEDQDERSKPGSEDVMSLDSESSESLDPPLTSYAEPADSTEVSNANTGVGFNEETVIDMVRDNSRYLDDATNHLAFDDAAYHHGFDDDILSIDEDEDLDNDTNSPMRSCATKRSKPDKASSSEKKPISSSWVMVQVKHKPTEKRKYKVEIPKYPGFEYGSMC